MSWRLRLFCSQLFLTQFAKSLLDEQKNPLSSAILNRADNEMQKIDQETIPQSQIEDKKGALQKKKKKRLKITIVQIYPIVCRHSNSSRCCRHFLCFFLYLIEYPPIFFSLCKQAEKKRSREAEKKRRREAKKMGDSFPSSDCFTANCLSLLQIFFCDS